MIYLIPSIPGIKSIFNMISPRGINFLFLRVFQLRPKCHISEFLLTAELSPALNKSLEIQHFESSDAIEIFLFQLSA